MLAATINPKAKMIIITDAGFQNSGFRYIKSLGWDFIGRIRGNTQLRLNDDGETWLKLQGLKASNKSEYLEPGTLSRTEYARCNGHFYLTSPGIG